jgi:nicotinamidase-related amidase
MSLKKYALISLAIVVVFVAAAGFVVVKKIYTPTQGKKISAYPNPRKALLVIDVQEDYTGLKGKQPVLFSGVEDRIATINRLIDHASKSGMKVAYIRQLFDDNFIVRLLGGRTIEGQPGSDLDSRIRIVNQNDFTKKISDAFSNPRLDAFLVQNQVDELYLVGLDAAYCVYNTALGARNRGYKVTAISDAIMTRKDMNDVLRWYEKDGILLASSKEVIGMRDKALKRDVANYRPR